MNKSQDKPEKKIPGVKTEALKKCGIRLLFLPGWLLLVLGIVSTVLLVSVFLQGQEETVWAYGIYVFAFYILTAASIFFSKVLPQRCRRIRQRIYENKWGRRYMTDVVFKTHVSLYLSLTANLLYAGMNILSFCLYRSMWFVVLGVYYMILAVMRFWLLLYARRNVLGSKRLKELKQARLCLWILLTLNLVLSGMVLMILYQNKGFAYHGILIYVMALYTFYMTTHAVINLIKYRKYKSPVMTAAKVISLSAALVSMLTLETAMFSAFGENMKTEDQRLMIILTGAGVSITVITMAAVMLWRCAKEQKTIQKEVISGSEKLSGGCT